MLDLLAFKATDVPTTNLIYNGDFSKGLVGWTPSYNSILDVTDNKITVETGTAAYPGALTTISGISVGDVAYISAEFNSDNFDDVHRVRIQSPSSNWTNVVAEADNYKTGEWQKISNTFVSAGNNTTLKIGFETRNISAKPSVKFKNVLLINLTQTFGAGNEPSAKQMDMLLEQFPNSWFDDTKNLFNAKEFLNIYHKKITELENAITALGGGS